MKPKQKMQQLLHREFGRAMTLWGAIEKRSTMNNLIVHQQLFRILKTTLFQAVAWRVVFIYAAAVAPIKWYILI